MNNRVALDSEQSKVAAIAVDDRQIVLAGPGSGKTEVVGRLVEQLLGDGVGPDEILLLSFSKAAVAATRGRIDLARGSGCGVDVATIDSLAARVLTTLSDVEPNRLGFDRTVREATLRLSTGETEVLDDVAHLIIDEAQDVVGVRLIFVLTMVDILLTRGAGFTLLGDPMQAIYDFQTTSQSTAADIFAEVRRRTDATERRLTHDYRSRNDYSRAAARRRVQLLDAAPEERRRILERSVIEVPPLGVLDEDSVSDIARWSGTTAILCDTNVSAVLAAEQAARSGLGVEVAPRREDPSIPSWVGQLLQERDQELVTREEFIDMNASLAPVQAPDRWRALVETTRSRRDIRMSELTASLRSVVRSRALERKPESQVVASTVHRAKGLEFDNVVLVDPEHWSRADEDPDPVARRAFVALTRARDRIVRVRMEDPAGWYRHARRDGPAVWVRRLPRRGRRGRCSGILLEPWMARSLGPSVIDLRTCIHQDVSWRRSDAHISADGHRVPTWTAFTRQAVPVARTGEAFGLILAELTDPSLVRLPGIRGGRVEGLETVVGTAGTSGRGRHGFWVGARLSGALTFDWEREGIV